MSEISLHDKIMDSFWIVRQFKSKFTTRSCVEIFGKDSGNIWSFYRHHGSQYDILYESLEDDEKHKLFEWLEKNILTKEQEFENHGKIQNYIPHEKFLLKTNSNKQMSTIQEKELMSQKRNQRRQERLARIKQEKHERYKEELIRQRKEKQALQRKQNKSASGSRISQARPPHVQPPQSKPDERISFFSKEPSYSDLAVLYRRKLQNAKNKLKF